MSENTESIDVSASQALSYTTEEKREGESNDDSYGASCTSYYTTEEKKDSYSTLGKLLETKCADELVRQVILDMMGVCADITDALRVNLVTVEGSANTFGDSQLSVDVRRKNCCWCEKDIW